MAQLSFKSAQPHLCKNVAVEFKHHAQNLHRRKKIPVYAQQQYDDGIFIIVETVSSR